MYKSNQRSSDKFSKLVFTSLRAAFSKVSEHDSLRKEEAKVESEAVKS